MTLEYTLEYTRKSLVDAVLGFGWLGAALVQPALAAPFSFADTGRLAPARSGATATLLPNGQGLVAGGVGSSGALTSAELYDPARERR